MRHLDSFLQSMKAPKIRFEFLAGHHVLLLEEVSFGNLLQLHEVNQFLHLQSTKGEEYLGTD